MTSLPKAVSAELGQITPPALTVGRAATRECMAGVGAPLSSFFGVDFAGR